MEENVIWLSGWAKNLVEPSDLRFTDEGIIGISHGITYLILHQNDGQGGCVIQ